MTGDIRVLIVDDEPLARRGIRQFLSRRPGFVVIGESRNGREALEILETATTDLVFLDVQMPELDGFEVIRARGAERMPEVVFVTAYDTYAVRAFEAHALDYLVKPVTDERFDATIARVRERVSARNAIALRERLQALMAGTSGQYAAAPNGFGSDRQLTVPTTTGDVMLDAAEIDWISAVNYCSELHVGARRYVLRESLNSLAARLESSDFVRVHRSAIVNMARIRELRSTGDNVVVILCDGTSVPVSRRRRELVASLLRRLHSAS